MAEIVGVVLGAVPIALKALESIATARSALTALSEATDRFLVMSFLPLQRERIESIQKEIEDLVSRMRREAAAATGQVAATAAAGPESNAGRHAAELNEEVDKLLSKYAKAIRNYETLSQEAIDPFIVSRTQVVFEAILVILGSEKHIKKRNARLAAQRGLKGMSWAEANNSYRELNRDFRIMKQKKEAFTERLWMGAFGGVAVIRPMILMVLKPDRNTSLITVSVATAIFIIVLAYGAKGLAGKDVLAATAAYAAVLVVFVGTSMAPASGAGEASR
ncbi:hypothetical protein B0T21DRAFT_376666 [Apiosordaria backusii]|uniref:DUF6594 domain-containing protein n=1 Tax=Apiosordaria backusii TaxID=314023 RepID=A0AA40A708_9PEZI|nr:hypothetical protein B0T21DRAFT_376666 [Apiosordaria backusii]